MNITKCGNFVGMISKSRNKVREKPVNSLTPTATTLLSYKEPKRSRALKSRPTPFFKFSLYFCQICVVPTTFNYEQQQLRSLFLFHCGCSLLFTPKHPAPYELVPMPPMTSLVLICTSLWAARDNALPRKTLHREISGNIFANNRPRQVSHRRR